MAASSCGAENRFLGRVADYERARPGYPLELLDFLSERGALFPGARVVDLGSGTGLFTEPFLLRDHQVFAVEPNSEMRAAAQRRFAREQGFVSVDGRAEHTGLADRSVELAVAAQAFHWFDPVATRRELRRVLTPPHQVALVWNARRAAGSRFLEGYEALLHAFGTDYTQVGHRGVGPERLAGFFGGPYETFRVENRQALDRDDLRSRLLSSSYIPEAGTARHAELLAALDRLFFEASSAGTVEIIYDCELFLGNLGELP